MFAGILALSSFGFFIVIREEKIGGLSYHQGSTAADYRVYRERKGMEGS